MFLRVFLVFNIFMIGFGWMEVDRFLRGFRLNESIFLEEGNL